MRIFLVSDSKTGINFFPQLEGLLRARIADAEIEQVFVPFPEDVPAAVNNILEEADLVFVFVLYEELDYKVKMLTEKLVDIDMKSETKIVKAVEETWIDTVEPMLMEQEKEKLAEKWADFIVDRLFKPDSFKPKEKQGYSGL